MPAGEFELIERYFAHCAAADGNPAKTGVLTGIGDDAAVLAPPGACRLFTEAMTASDTERKLLAADALAVRTLVGLITRCYCRGLQPRWYTLNLALHKADPGWLQAFSRGLANCSRDYSLALVGGDTTGGKDDILLRMFATAQQHETLPKTHTGRQLVYLNGCPGAAALVRADLEGNRRIQAGREQLMQAYLYPRIDPAWLILLQHFAVCAAGLHEGLDAAIAGLHRHTRQEFNISFPLQHAREMLCENPDSLELPPDTLMQSAEIAQLCYTIPVQRRDAMLAFAAQHRLQPVLIGESL